MSLFVWCAVGLVSGWIAAVLVPAPGFGSRIENVLVAVFGAFIGGEFLASFTGGAAAATGVRTLSLGLAIGGAIVMLVLLALMRRAVGPMRPRKARRKARP